MLHMLDREQKPKSLLVLKMKHARAVSIYFLDSARWRKKVNSPAAGVATRSYVKKGSISQKIRR